MLVIIQAPIVGFRLVLVCKRPFFHPASGLTTCRVSGLGWDLGVVWGPPSTLLLLHSLQSPNEAGKGTTNLQAPLLMRPLCLCQSDPDSGRKPEPNSSQTRRAVQITSIELSNQTLQAQNPNLCRKPCIKQKLTSIR